MKKQVLFPRFMTRVFSTVLDMLILCLCFMFVEPFLKKIAISMTIEDILLRHNVDINNAKAMQEFFSSYLKWGSDEMRLVVKCFFIFWLMEIVLLISYLSVFWYKFGATPAKFLMRLKVVDQNTLDAPTLKQVLVRAFFALFAVVGLWFTLFTKNKQSLHDLASGTVVIKA